MLPGADATFPESGRRFRARSTNGNVRRESDFANHFRRVLLTYVRVDLQQKCAIVFMPKPASDGADIAASLKAIRPGVRVRAGILADAENLGC